MTAVEGAAGLTVWGEFLLPIEHEAIATLAELSRTMADVIANGGHGAVADADYVEAVQHIHALQRMIGGQAAARAYPGMYRLLGRPL